MNTIAEKELLVPMKGVRTVPARRSRKAKKLEAPGDRCGGPAPGREVKGEVVRIPLLYHEDLYPTASSERVEPAKCEGARASHVQGLHSSRLNRPGFIGDIVM
jgi:hypothetical protein